MLPTRVPRTSYPLHPWILHRIAVLAFSISNWLYDFAQLHNDVTKVQSFGENIAVERGKKPVSSYYMLVIPIKHKLNFAYDLANIVLYAKATKPPLCRSFTREVGHSILDTY